MLLLAFVPTLAQERKTYSPVWTYHQSNIQVRGLSVGWFPLKNTLNTTTTGLRLEVPGSGWIFFLAGVNPLGAVYDSTRFTQEEIHMPEKINGLSLSATGSTHTSVNGVCIGGIGHMGWRINGFSAAPWLSYMHTSHGFQLSGLHASSHRMKGLQLAIYTTAEMLRGVQIGVVTKSRNTRGLQFGLWNVNEKRRLPVFNWNFKP